MISYRENSINGLPPVNKLLLSLEILIVIIASIWAASVYVNFDPYMRPGGEEAEYLTYQAYSAGQLIHERGYIPLWIPYLEMGDPIFENLYTFAFNPFLTLPSFVLDGANGIKIAILLMALVAGLGGWALARVMGLGLLARIFLGLLCLGKGNMHSYLAGGHFGLFAMQAFFPWILVGVFGILRGIRRWPVILLALSFALVFWSGTPWFPPSIALIIGVLTLVYCIHISRDTTRNTTALATRLRIHIDWKKIGLMVAAMLLTILLVANTIIPLVTKKSYLGKQTVVNDYVADLGTVINFYFDPAKRDIQTGEVIVGEVFVYYSFILPLWFALSAAGLLAVVSIMYYRQCKRLIPLPWRFIGSALLIVVFYTLWGAGRNPIIPLIERLIPVATQFRHAQRVLALSSLMIGMLAAVSVDALWFYMIEQPTWLSGAIQNKIRFRTVLRYGVSIVLAIATGLAGFQVAQQWHVSWGEAFTTPENQWEDICVSWLRQQHPNEELSIWTLEYNNIYTYLRNRVRHGWIGSDFYHLQPLPFTVYQVNLIPSYDVQVAPSPSDVALPEYSIGVIHHSDEWLAAHGYRPIPESANYIDPGKPCLYHRDDALKYAFTAVLPQLQQLGPISARTTEPVTTFVRDYDRVAMVVTSRNDIGIVAAVQEVAFPGWTVKVDGEAAQLESVGGLIGVALPPDGQQHTILFQYLPANFFIGLIVTLITSILCVLYLLRVDRRLLMLLRRKKG